MKIILSQKKMGIIFMAINIIKIASTQFIIEKIPQIILKRLFSTKEQLKKMALDDPFWALLTKGVSDFYATEN